MYSPPHPQSKYNEFEHGYNRGSEQMLGFDIRKEH